MADVPAAKLAAPTSLATNEVANVANALNIVLADSYALYIKA